MSMNVRNAEGRFTTYTTHRTVTYRKAFFYHLDSQQQTCELKMLESPNALLGGHYLIVLGENTIEVASTKQDAYRMLDAAENVLKAVGWVLVSEVNA
jgi:hypothetical protein